MFAKISNYYYFVRITIATARDNNSVPVRDFSVSNGIRHGSMKQNNNFLFFFFHQNGSDFINIIL